MIIEKKKDSKPTTNQLNNSHMGGMKKTAHIGKDAQGNIESWGDIFTRVDGENENEQMNAMKETLKKAEVTPLGGSESSDCGYTYKV